MSKSNIYRQNRGSGAVRGKALQLGRRVTAVVALSLMTIYFVMLGTSAAVHLKWIARIQIVPAALAVSGSLILLWILITLLFGRVYCSMVCPLGVTQDIFAKLPRMSRRRKFRNGYRYRQPANRFRYGFLALIVASALAGVSMLLALFDPYSAFGRIMTYLLRPLVDIASGKELVSGALVGVAVAAVTLIAVGAVAFRKGRMVCNSVCPVGAVLGIISRHSVFCIDINADMCVSCGLCERVCKARCIDPKAHTVDTSRCVVCFNCTAVCDNGAITYTRNRHPLSLPMLMKVPGRQAAATLDVPSPSDSATAVSSGSRPLVSRKTEEPAVKPVDRRKFLAAGLILAAAPAVVYAEKHRRRIEALDRGQQPTSGTRPVTPPGILSTRNFLSRCVGCGACIAACPADVLRPSKGEYGVGNPLHPLKDYDVSYCRYSCVRCTEVCPTGALNPLTVEEKHLFRVGLATVDAQACVGCGMCVRRCPTRTIAMIKDGARRVAKVDLDGCIGCGSCQYICPATPVKAIKVNGLRR